MAATISTLFTDLHFHFHFHFHPSSEVVGGACKTLSIASMDLDASLVFANLSRGGITKQFGYSWLAIIYQLWPQFEKLVMRMVQIGKA